MVFLVHHGCGLRVVSAAFYASAGSSGSRATSTGWCGGYDIVVTVTGPRQTVVTFRKAYSISERDPMRTPPFIASILLFVACAFVYLTFSLPWYVDAIVLASLAVVALRSTW